MKHKKFFYIVVISLAVFLVYNYLVWKLHTEDLLRGKTGDLSRLGYKSSMAQLKENINDLPRKHIESINFKGGMVDVLTIGDSFSRGHAERKNPFYQDYIAAFNDSNVLNIPRYKDKGYLSTIVILLNSGWIDKYKPRDIIVQSVERNCIRNFTADIDFDASEPLENVERYLGETENTYVKPSDVSFINTGNFKFLLFNFLYLFSDNAFFSQVYIKNLDAPLFTSGIGRKLLFYVDDIKNIRQSTDQSVSKLNDNLNYLADRLEAKGIKLHFMPAVDKYDLYSDHIIRNPYPKSVFFEKLRRLPKRYNIIDSKRILSEEVNRGEKDIFYPDDTHWSWKASRKIFEDVRFQEGAPRIRSKPGLMAK